MKLNHVNSMAMKLKQAFRKADLICGIHPEFIKYVNKNITIASRNKKSNPWYVRAPPP